MTSNTHTYLRFTARSGQKGDERCSNDVFRQARDAGEQGRVAPAVARRGVLAADGGEDGEAERPRPDPLVDACEAEEGGCLVEAEAAVERRAADAAGEGQACEGLERILLRANSPPMAAPLAINDKRQRQEETLVLCRLVLQ